MQPKRLIKATWFMIALLMSTLTIVTAAKADATTNFQKYYTVKRQTTFKYQRYQTKELTDGVVQPLPNGLIHVVNKVTTPKGVYAHIYANHQDNGWVNDHALSQNTHRLMTPVVKQRPQLPTGCEIVATTMMINFAGDNSTKYQLAKEMPRSKNPNKGFVGNPYSKSGWYVYPKGLTKLVKHHLGSSVDLTGASNQTLKKYLAKDHLVVLWLGYFDGFSNHAVTLTGYSTNKFYFNDPWTGTKRSLSLKTITKHRKLDAYRALSY